MTSDEYDRAVVEHRKTYLSFILGEADVTDLQDARREAEIAAAMDGISPDRISDDLDLSESSADSS